jgi:hypothetical protein
MKKLALSALLLTTVMFGSGCAQYELGRNEFGSTPAYSLRERGSHFGRMVDIDLKEVNDDIDEILMLRPASMLSVWHVR